MPPLIHDAVRCFVALAENGTLAQAGDRVSKSPSAVSLQIAALEERLGAPLFVRHARGMELSPAGRALLGPAQALLAAEAAAVAQVRAAALAGELRFGMPQDFASSRLAGTLDRFRRAQTAVRVTAVIERNRVVTAMARRGELDLALLIARRPLAGALASSRRRSRWYASPRLQWSRARPLPLVLLEEPCVYRADALAALRRAGIRAEIAFVTGNVPAMWAAVAGGVGVTARMDLGAPDAAQAVDDRFALPPLPATTLSLLQPVRPAAPSARALAALVGEALRSIDGPA